MVADSVHSKEALPFGHLDATAFYLAQMDHDVSAWVLNEAPPKQLQTDVVYAMDRFDLCAHSWGAVRVAQVAAVCRPMPWECIKSDGTHAYDLVLSSIPRMVEAARATGCRAELVPLCFDTRALTCGMGVKRDLGCIFVGTTGANHRRRTALLEELRDVVEVHPPTFGHAYFKLLARARAVFNAHAEWSRGSGNNMRQYEALGMGAALVTDEAGPFESTHGVWTYHDVVDARRCVIEALADRAHAPEFTDGQADVLTRHSYVQRIPAIVELIRGLL